MQTQKPHLDPRVNRVIEQHAKTASLLGVHFVPVYRSARVTAPPVSVSDSDSPPAPPAPPESSVLLEISESPQQQETTSVSVQTTMPNTKPSTGNHAMQLDRLRDRHAAECPHCTTATGWNNLVFGDGDPNAKLMFVGEAPGADEDAAGKPFVGRSGKLLNKMIEAIGLDRERVYIANILKCRPPNNATPTPAQAAACGPYLREQIDILRPKAIVTLGLPATRYLLETREAMGKLRGSWATYTLDDGTAIDVMPTYHPAYLLRSYTQENRAKVWSDLQCAMERVEAAAAD